VVFGVFAQIAFRAGGSDLFRDSRHIDRFQVLGLSLELRKAGAGHRIGFIHG
jgi:hypothetical protein